jgi:hypothetical protein
MADYLSEQMRSLTRRLEELAQNPLPDTGLEGSLNAKQLAELLGVSDLQTFTRSMNKIRAGDADKLNRAEMTELAEAFVRLLAAEAEDTQKAMQALKRVSAKEEPVMEADGGGKVHNMGISKLRKVIASGKYSLEDANVDINNPNIMGKVLTVVNPKNPDGFKKTQVKVSTDRSPHPADTMFKH